MLILTLPQERDMEEDGRFNCGGVEDTDVGTGVGAGGGGLGLGDVCADHGDRQCDPRAADRRGQRGRQLGEPKRLPA